MMLRRLVTIFLPVAIGLLAAGSVAPAQAAANNLVIGHCSKTSHYALQVQRESPRTLSVEWGVDMARNRAGVKWSYGMSNNGVQFAAGPATTLADGSWTVTRLIPRRFKNRISAAAKNPATGETCFAATTIF